MMGRSPCCDDKGLKKGPWTPEEDRKLVEFIQQHGHGSWRALPKLAGLNRCGKSCRLRWTNYLRPDIKRGKFTEDEEQTIIDLHSLLGNKWSAIAGHLAGRTDNEIKNFWNTHLKKKLLNMGIDPLTHKPRTDLNLLANLPQLLFAANLLTSATASAATAPPVQLDRNVLMNPPPLSLHSNGHMNDSTLQSDATHHQLAAKIHILRNILQVLTTNTTASTASCNNHPSASVAAAIQDSYSPADILTNTTISPNLPTGLVNMPFHHHQNQEIVYDDRFPNCNFSSFEPPPPHASQQVINAHHDVDDPPMIMMMPPPASSSNIVINQQQNARRIPNHNHHRISTALPQPIARNSTSTSPSTPVPTSSTDTPASFGTCDGRDQMPSLVPASPDQRMNEQKEEGKFNTSTNYDEDISYPSSTATTFDALNDIIDDEASNSYWKDIIQQASSPSWPISSYIHGRHFGS